MAAVATVRRVICGEIQTVLMLMRRSPRWAQMRQNPGGSAWSELVFMLETARRGSAEALSADAEDSALDGGAETRFSSAHYTPALLAVVRSEQTSGAVTEAALAAILKLLQLDFLALEDVATARAALVSIVFSVTRCRFEAAAAPSDENVLMYLLQVLLACVRCSSEAQLSDAAVCEIVQACFRILAQPQHSLLLRRAAESSLVEIVTALFAPLDTLAARRGGGEARGGAAEDGGRCAPEALSPRARQPLSADARSSESLEGSLARADGSAREHGMAALCEILRFLCELAAPASAEVLDGSGADGTAVWLQMAGLNLLKTALQAAGGGLARAPPLLALLQEKLALSLAQIGARSVAQGLPCATDGCEDADEPRTAVVSLALQCAALLVVELGSAIKPQAEALVHGWFCHALLRLPAAPRPADAPAAPAGAVASPSVGASAPCAPGAAAEGACRVALGELVLEALTDLCEASDLELAQALYAHFDCDPLRADLLADLCKALAHAAGSECAPLAVRCLLALLRRLAACAIERHALAEHDADADADADAGIAGGGSGADGGAAADELAVAEAGARGGGATTAALRLCRRIQAECAEAAAEFNAKPSRGVGALVRAGLLAEPPRPEAIAALLRAVPQLSRAAIGEFLGGPSAEEVATLRAYARLFDLARLRVDLALRVFLSGFALPGEAQKIDRVVEAFAAAYFEQQQAQRQAQRRRSGGGQPEAPSACAAAAPPSRAPPLAGVEPSAAAQPARPGTPAASNEEAAGEREAEGEAQGEAEGVSHCFVSADGVYVLSFSLVMLNTDLHSAHVRDKMSLEGFVRNTRGIDSGHDLPRSLLAALYEAIRLQPLRLVAGAHDGADGGSSGARPPPSSAEAWEECSQRARAAPAGRLALAARARAAVARAPAMRWGGRVAGGSGLGGCSAADDAGLLGDALEQLWPHARAAFCAAADGADARGAGEAQRAGEAEAGAWLSSDGTSGDVLERAFEGLLLCAQVAAATERAPLVDQVCRLLFEWATSRARDDEGAGSPRAAGGGPPAPPAPERCRRARMAACALGRLAAEHGAALGADGWRCYARLVLRDALSISGAGLSGAACAPAARGAPNATPPSSNKAALEPARARAAAAYRLADVLRDSKFLPHESLAALADALADEGGLDEAASGVRLVRAGRAAHGADDPSARDLAARALALELVSELGARNRDRVAVGPVWQTIERALENALCAEPCDGALAATAACEAARLVARLAPRGAAAAARAYDALEHVLRMRPLAAAQAVPRACAGLGRMCRAAAPHLRASARGWRVACAVAAAPALGATPAVAAATLGGLSRDGGGGWADASAPEPSEVVLYAPAAADAGIALLGLLAAEPCAVCARSYPWLAAALCAYAQPPQPPLAPGPQAAAMPVELRVRAVQLLGALGDRLGELAVELCPQLPAAAADCAAASGERASRGSGLDGGLQRCGTPAEVWAATWVPLAHTLACCAGSAPDELAAAALTAFSTLIVKHLVLWRGARERSMRGGGGCS